MKRAGSFVPTLLVAGASLAVAQPADGPLGADAPVAPAPPPIAHTTLPVTLAGDYVLDPAKTAGLYGDAYGTVTVQQLGKQARVRDQHYVLSRDANGKPTQVGLRMIPVSDPHTALAEGEEPDPKQPGSHLIDRFLRQAQGLKPSDPIFALAVYMTPHDPSDQAWRRRAQGTSTHVSVYLGQGFTRSSPEAYKSNGWGVKGYPAIVQLVRLEGTDAATLNRNGHIAAAILNTQVVFPGGSQPDESVTLARTLAFYRGWLRDDPSVRQMATSSAEHIALITNVMVNVPHDAASFRDLWGEEGPELLALAKAKYRAATGKALPETSFKPLWKRDGIKTPTSGKGQRVGQALAWRPEHALDQLERGLELYARWPELGGLASARQLMRLARDLRDRMRREKPSSNDRALKRFVEAVIPQMFLHEAMTLHTRSALAAYYRQSADVLYVAVGGDPDDLRSRGGVPNPWRMSLVDAIRSTLRANKKELVKRAKAKTSPGQAYALFQKALAEQLRLLRSAYEGSPSGPRYESSSALTQHIATGLHRSHAKVTIESVATVFEAEELTTKAELAKRPKADVAATVSGGGTGVAEALDKSTNEKD